MKVYMISVYLFEEGVNIIVTRTGNIREKHDTVSFDIKTWFGEPDWHKIINVLGFFDAEWVCISPRFGNADDFTSPKPTVIDCDVEYAARENKI